jgi:hypothetical protein
MSLPSKGCSDVRWKYAMAEHWAEVHAEQVVPCKITVGLDERAALKAVDSRSDLPPACTNMCDICSWSCPRGLAV